MLFNSFEFLIFLPTIYILYWFVFNRNIKVQNMFIVTASYFFYGWWDWRFLSLIFLSTILDFYIGINLVKSKQLKKRRILLLCSLIFNLGMLGTFKYYNFFLDSFISAFSFFGYNFNPTRLKIILPVGISFYTFQTLSYSIDVYRKKMSPSKDFIAFAAYVSFFPQLVAGPIERATHLLPQFQKKRNFSYALSVDGLKQILWGFFKKIVISDGCSLIVNSVFKQYSEYSSLSLFLTTILFSLQIYGDFSGYSDIAIGTSRLFGFDLMQNFNFPYFSRDIAEFWRRWHISLSTWFRDYLYIPLGGSRKGTVQNIKNIFIIFLVSGLWHGARWGFIIWGFLNALYFIPLQLLKLNRRNMEIIAYKQRFPDVKEFLMMISTFCLISLTWVFFRSESLHDSFSYLYHLFSFKGHSISELYLKTEIGKTKFLIQFFMILLFITLEWIGRRDNYAIQNLFIKKKSIKWLFHYSILFFILISLGNGQSFIYFQF